MAEKILKSLKFPGLEDTYVVPEAEVYADENSDEIATVPLNADTLGGYSASDFAPTVHNHSANDITSGVLTLERGGTGSYSDLKNAPHNALITKVNNDSYNQLYYKASGNGAVYSTEANGAIKFGTLPIKQGGTDATDAATARANLGAAPSGYGLGNDFETVSDKALLDGRCLTGWVRYSNNSNVSLVPGLDIYHAIIRIDSMTNNSGLEYATQTAYPAYNNTYKGCTFQRYCHGGVWSEWVKIYTNSDIDTLVNNGKTKCVQVWANASPASTFEGDTYIDIGENNKISTYDWILVMCRYSTGYGYIACSDLIYNTLGGTCVFIKGYPGSTCMRWFRRDGGNQGRYVYVSHGYKEGTQDNTVCIPTHIYGIKW